MVYSQRARAHCVVHELTVKIGIEMHVLSQLREALHAILDAQLFELVMQD